MLAAQRGQIIPDLTTPFLQRMTSTQREHSRLFHKFSTKTRILDRGLSILSDEKASFEDPSAPVPSAVAKLSDLTCTAEEAVAVSVLNATSNPTEDGTFLFTDYETTIDQVLLARSSRLQPKAHLIVTRPGGEITLAREKVRAVPGGFPLLQVGHQYVVFGRVVKTTGALLSEMPDATFTLTNGRVTPLGPFDVQDSDALRRDGLSLNEFARLIQQRSCR